ncbi:MAG: PLP-dependent aminotransferase family protein [Candidatus Cohnella colombiensis]|uniref:PLP-dependent aminotransferase family protein n=1 Tax=Candidatus Cohnella colombiensis TaxID=3121368 RepID=A0AA95EW35_9BACL|nr:MAG: PLP-dependent aminotransferase family protein [Cohnella sp.]
MLELLPNLIKQPGIPLYFQLYQYIKEEIVTGSIEVGAKLPSIRQLSNHLHLSKNTIETAYQQLIAEGYVESRSRSGLYVISVEESIIPLVEEVLSKDKPVPQKDEFIEHMINFQYGDVELEHFPLAVWKKCLNTALHEAPLQDVLGYGERQGNMELRVEIARYLFQARGVRCSSDQIVICSGTQQAINLLCQLLQLQGKRIAMEEPGYHGVRTVFHNHGCTTHPIPLDSDGINVEQLQQSGANTVYVTPSHQFPMGMVLPIQKRNRLLQWANAYDSLIIEDDYDSEFRYIGQPIPALKSLDHNGRVIYLGTFSKSFLPAMRMSYIVLPDPLVASFCERLEPYSQSASSLLQHAVMRFMRNGHFERHIRKMRRLYHAKHEALLSAVHTYMGDRVEVIGQKSGLHLLLNVHNNHTRDQLIASAKAVGVIVYSPRQSWSEPESCPASYIMLGFGGLSEQSIDTGIRKLAHAWFDGL